MIRIALICALFFSSSCSSVINKKPKSFSQNQDLLTFETIEQDFYGGITDSKFLVINDLKSLHDIYDAINKDRLPILEIPTINFEKEMVLALFLGEKTTGGFSISVERILSDNNNVSVFYKTITPKQDEMVTTVMTQPYCIIKMPKTSKEVVFKKIDL